jgi:hypothetical protein
MCYNFSMTKFQIQKSNISGNGIFAKEDILAHENIGLGFKKISNTGNPDTDYTRTELGTMINHSENPNVILSQNNNDLFILSTRKIKAGEELFLDYTTIPWEGKREF